MRAMMCSSCLLRQLQLEMNGTGMPISICAERTSTAPVRVERQTTDGKRRRARNRADSRTSCSDTSFGSTCHRGYVGEMLRAHEQCVECKTRKLKPRGVSGFVLLRARTMRPA